MRNSIIGGVIVLVLVLFLLVIFIPATLKHTPRYSYRELMSCDITCLDSVSARDFAHTVQDFCLINGFDLGTCGYAYWLAKERWQNAQENSLVFSYLLEVYTPLPYRH